MRTKFLEEFLLKKNIKLSIENQNPSLKYIKPKQLVCSDKDQFVISELDQETTYSQFDFPIEITSKKIQKVQRSQQLYEPKKRPVTSLLKTKQQQYKKYLPPLNRHSIFTKRETPLKNYPQYNNLKLQTQQKNKQTLKQPTSSQLQYNGPMKQFLDCLQSDLKILEALKNKKNGLQFYLIKIQKQQKMRSNFNKKKWQNFTQKIQTNIQQ